MITLAQSKVGGNDKVYDKVIDIFIQESEILELMPFDNAVNANGSSTMIYGYVQEKTASTAAFRAIGSEYTASEATVDKKTAQLAIFGGAFEIDRVIKDLNAQFNNLEYQLRKKIQAAVALFHDGMINGDVASDANAFDGLDKMLVGTKSEFNATGTIDISTKAALEENASDFYEQLTTIINRTGANAILCNGSAKTKIQTVARYLGYKTESEEAFGRVVHEIGGVRIIDLKNKVGADGAETPIIATSEGLTDIYAIRFDVNDGFHGVSLSGNKVVDTYLPDFNAPNAMKKGEVEMVACVALKNTNAAAVLRNVKVA